MGTQRRSSTESSVSLQNLEVHQTIPPPMHQPTRSSASITQPTAPIRAISLHPSVFETASTTSVTSNPRRSMPIGDPNRYFQPPLFDRLPLGSYVPSNPVVYSADPTVQLCHM